MKIYLIKVNGQYQSALPGALWHIPVGNSGGFIECVSAVVILRHKFKIPPPSTIFSTGPSIFSSKSLVPSLYDEVCEDDDDDEIGNDVVIVVVDDVVDDLVAIVVLFDVFFWSFGKDEVDDHSDATCIISSTRYV